MPPAILLYTESVEPSGMGEQMLTLAETLRERYRFIVACPSVASSARLLERARAAGLGARPVPEEARLEAWFERLRVDIVHNHAGVGWEGLPGVHAAHRAGFPVIRTEHLPYVITEPGQRTDHRRMLGQVRLLVCVSQGALETFLGAGCNPARLRVVRNGVHDRSEAPDRIGVRAELGLDPDAPLLLSVGRFRPQKNYGLLLQAAERVLERFPRAHFAWVGEGPLSEPLRREAASRGLASHIHFLGRREDVPRLMAGSELLLLPSQFEGLPLAALEAMAAGLPVIGAAVCGLCEVVRPGETGLLAAPNDPLALAAAVCDALSSPEQVERWRRNSRAAFEREWRAERMARDMDVVYREVLESASAVAPAKGF